MKPSDIIKIISESLLLAILTLISLRFYISFQLNLFGTKINGLPPLLFLPFLISPYVRKSAKFLGWFLGGIFLTFSLSTYNILLILFTSIFLGGFGYFYAYSSKNRPQNPLDIILNMIITIISLWIIAGIVAVIYDAKNIMTFNQAYSIFFNVGIIVTLIINTPLMYFYNNKLLILS